MNNLGAREKYGFMLLGIVVLVFLIYFFGIRTAQSDYDSLVAQRSQLSATLEYYEQLKNQNASAEAEILAINESISQYESRFLPLLSTESIEQYVLSVFESNGCPYLSSVTTENISVGEIILPDGTKSEDSIVAKRITLTYSTTDGFNIPQYNMSFTVNSNGVPDEELVNELIDGMQWIGTSGIVGYDEFLSSLEELENVDPNCIKLNSISVKSEGGYMLMTASIDFYSATFINRVSTPNTNAPYITYAGAAVDTDGGFIGMPFVVDDPNSAWFGICMTDADATAGNRPFSAYFSNVLFRESVTNIGLIPTLGIGDSPIVDEPVD